MTYRTAFTIEEMPEHLSLLFENRAVMGEHRFILNGTEIPGSSFRHARVTDFNNTAADIRSLVKPGGNILEVCCEIEESWHGVSDPLYLVGDFGVSDKVKLSAQPKQAVFRPGYTEGFPYFSGTMTYSGSFEGEPADGIVELRLDKRVYDCVELEVNGEALGVRAFTPYRWFIDGAKLKKGQNAFTLRVTNTLANMLDGRYFDYDGHKLVEI